MKRFLLFICLMPAISYADKLFIDSFLVSIDFPISSKEFQFTQRFSYSYVKDTSLIVRLRSFYLRNASDSQELYDAQFEVKKLNSELGYLDLPFSKALSLRNTNNDFFDIITRFQMVPAGVYHTEVQLLSAKEKNKVLWGKTFIQYADSTLSHTSGLRDRMNDAMARSKSSAKKKLSKKRSPSSAQQDAELKASQSRMKRGLRSVKGLELNPVTLAGKTYNEAYYKGFFLGRYEMASVNEMSDRAKKESGQLSDNAASMVNTEMEGFRGVGSQLKDLNSKKKKESRMKGMIDVSTFRASSQDPQSAIEQNYTELLGNVDVEVMGLPCSLEGFYTTQDQNRKAKASYIRFHYDVESAKSKLKQALDGYKSKLGETMTKGQGLENIYGSYAEGLEKQRASMLKKMAKEYDIDPETITRNGGNADKIARELPADSNGNAKKQKLQKNKKDIGQRYEQIVALQQKADKYHKLLENYSTQNRLDSIANYQKIAGLNEKDPSYKDMSKAAAGILPEGKAKKFVTGITSFDAGIINKYESQYTMSGQTMKGVSMGYDFGLCTSGITLGSTEYVSREGNVDHYSTMLLRVDNKGAKNHKLGFLYNVSTPAKSMSMDERFIGSQGVRYPGFTTPNQVLSVVYDGTIGSRLSLHSELASSFKKGQATSFDMAHAATNTGIAYRIPKTTINVNGTWEHLGSSFENNTLPYIRSGTERYTIGTGFDLFRSFLGIKVDYNFLVQENFAMKSYNRKWGFEAKTHSKRYPTVSFSYKPFSTFRSLADTLQVARRPIQGEVWTGRASYQFKRKKNLHRFTLMYNRNSSTMDTISYRSATAQAGYMYAAQAHGLSLNLSVGRIELPADFNDGSGITSSYTALAAVNKTIGKWVTLSASPDVALCAWGLQRLSGTLGCSFSVPDKPLTFRMTLRCSNYRLKESDPVQDLYAGQLGVNWRFKAPEKRKK